MRRLTAAAILAAALLPAPARADWVDSVEPALKEAKEKNKLLLIYIWSPSCHVCKALNEKVWPNIAVQTELENFVAVKTDNGVIAQSRWKWKIDDVPQIRVVDPDGNEWRSYTRNDVLQGSVEKMLDFLKAIQDEWKRELASRVVEWEASHAEAKAKAAERQRPILYFVHEGAVPQDRLAGEFPIFTDKTVTVPSKKFICVNAPKDMKDVWDRYKPAVVPGFVFVDLDGAEIHRCGLLPPADLAREFEAAAKKFDDTLVVDPAKVLERSIARWETALKGDVEQDKLDAAQKLIDAKDPKVVKPLAAGFADPSIKLKELLIGAMISIDPKAGLLHLLAWCPKEANHKLQVKGWDAIGTTGDLRAVRDLETNVLDAPTAEITNAKIRALGNMKDKQVVDFLIELPFKIKTKGRGPGGGGPGGAIKNSLNKLTGQDYGNDWLAWKRWWRDSQKSFKFPD